MRFAALLLLFLPAAALPDDLPRDIAAAHAEGKWKVRKADLYRHLVKYYRGYPSAKLVLPEYMRERLIKSEATKRKIVVTPDDVTARETKLDKQIRQKTGGTVTLDKERRRMGMSKSAFKRRMRLAVMRERVARDIVNKRDKTRDPKRELGESTVILTIDELYNKTKKVLDPKKLKKGIVAKVGDVEITAYQYGRELSFALPTTEVISALNDLILAEEVKLLTGNAKAATEEELAAEREWFVTYEVNRLKRIAQSQGQGNLRITREHVDKILERRGLTLDQALSSPGSRAQARARGHFRRSFDSALTDEQKKQAADDEKLRDKLEKESAAKDAKLRKFYEANKQRYGDQLRVARIFIAARAQQVGQIGKKKRNLQQGKATAEALWLRASQGAKFDKLARENSDDVDVIRKNGGVVPLWLTADMPGWGDSWQHANKLKKGQFSKPFYSRVGGFIIVKLLKRRKALGFAGLRDKILLHATEDSYRRWRDTSLRAARKSKGLLEK